MQAEYDIEVCASCNAEDWGSWTSLCITGHGVLITQGMVRKHFICLMSKMTTDNLFID